MPEREWLLTRYRSRARQTGRIGLYHKHIGAYVAQDPHGCRRDYKSGGGGGLG